MSYSQIAYGPAEGGRARGAAQQRKQSTESRVEKSQNRASKPSSHWVNCTALLDFSQVAMKVGRDKHDSVAETGRPGLAGRDWQGCGRHADASFIVIFERKFTAAVF